MPAEIAWLDRDLASQEQVRRLLDMSEEPRALDSLGLGAIRDALADEIAPGVSTAQSRLRYFVLIPWLFEQVAAASSRKPYTRRLRDGEVELIERLSRLGPRQGVIGLQSRSDLKVMPSTLYWTGLRTWEIARFDGSVRQAIERAGSARVRRVETDADGHRVEAGLDLWCELLPVPDGFLKRPEHLSLSIPEAEWLVDRLRSAAATRDSVLRHAADYADRARTAGKAERVGDWATPWDLPGDFPVGRLNNRNRDALHHARCVSEVTEGPRILYNVMLAECASQTSGGEDTSGEETSGEHSADEAQSKLECWSGRLGEWAERVSQPATAKRLEEWHRSLDRSDPAEGFWACLRGLRGREASVDLFRFVNDMATHVVKSPKDFNNRAIRERITQRECLLKGSRARLGPSGGPLKAWIARGMPFTGGAFDYRWTQVVGYLVDLAGAGRVGWDADASGPPGNELQGDGSAVPKADADRSRPRRRR